MTLLGGMPACLQERAAPPPPFGPHSIWGCPAAPRSGRTACSHAGCRTALPPSPGSEPTGPGASPGLSHSSQNRLSPRERQASDSCPWSLAPVPLGRRWGTCRLSQDCSSETGLPGRLFVSWERGLGPAAWSPHGAGAGQGRGRGGGSWTALCLLPILVLTPRPYVL